MSVISVSNLNLLAIADRKSKEIFYGCDQEWFKTEWQRLSGCGTSVAANIILYLNNKSHAGDMLQYVNDKDECLLFMEEIWEYVTPTNQGIPKTQLFYESMQSYIKLKGLNYEYKFMDLPADKSSRPELQAVLDFLKEALSQDVPVAFLNLSSGAEKNLESWHWVTIISLDCMPEEDRAHIFILDEGIIKKVDFALWYDTTARESGFVYFTECRQC